MAQHLVCCHLMLLQAHEYSFYFGYNGAPAATASDQSSATALLQAPADDQSVSQQQLAHEISNAADWPELLQLATAHEQQLTPALWLRLLFRWAGYYRISLLQEVQTSYFHEAMSECNLALNCMEVDVSCLCGAAFRSQAVCVTV